MVAGDIGLRIRGDGHVGAIVPFADIRRAHTAWVAGAGAGRALLRALSGDDRGLVEVFGRLPGADPMVVAGLLAVTPPGSEGRLRAALESVLSPEVEQHGHVLVDAADGAWDAVLGAVQGVGGLTVQALWDRRGTAANWRELAAGLGALGGLLVDDPGEATKVLLDRDTFNANKARWVGQAIPDAVAKVLSGGSSTAVTIPAMRRRLQVLDRAIAGAEDLEAAAGLTVAIRRAHRIMDQQLVREIVEQLPRGRSRSGRVRVVPTERQIDDLFVVLLGARRARAGRDHLRYLLPDRTSVQYRTKASSPPVNSIDLIFPDTERATVHIDLDLPPDAVDHLPFLRQETP